MVPDLRHKFDLNQFVEKIRFVADEWKRTKDKPVENSEETYFAPYFCFIQSSGMGKTKLLYEFAQVTRPTLADANEDENNTCKDISCDLILSGDILLENNRSQQECV
jgi:hypothetical protein